MSDETSQLEAEPVEQAPEAKPEPRSFDEAYVKKLREEAAGYRVKLKEYEDRDKSELERAQEAAEAAQRELAEARAESARLAVAAKHGIGADHLDLLTGDTEAEIEAKAVKLASLINTPQRAVIPGEPEKDLALNGSGIEDALKNALGIR